MDPNAPQDPIDPAHSVDISKILLPKKEGSPASAQRVNAGVLLEQEQKVITEEHPSQKSSVLLSEPQPGSAGQTFVQGVAPASETKPPSAVKQLETYQGDIESVVAEKKVSTVSIAAAEAERRAKAIHASPVTQEASLSWKIIFVALGVLLIAAAVGVLAYLYLRPTTVPVAVAVPSLIAVDSQQEVTLSPTFTPQESMGALEHAKESVHLPLGLVAQLFVLEASSTGTSPALMSPGVLLQTLTPYVPDQLVRTLQPSYVLGVHSYDENEAFLILKVDSYETAYAGMLAWETTMRQDLSPLFVRHPSPSAYPAPAATGSTTAATVPLASTSFVDQVVDNHDARVLHDPQGNIILLWTFLDRQTLVIANNDATLREVIVRLSTPAVQSLPQ